VLHRGLLDGPKGPVAEAAGVPDWPQQFASLAAAARHAALQAYYAAGVPTPDAPLSAVPMAALDIETTGLDPRQHEIVSVALVPFQLAQIQASRSRHWVVRPRGELTAESVAFHGITHAQIAVAPDLEAVLASLLAAMAGRVMVVHCRDIERDFLDAALRARWGEGLQFPVIDTMDLEARRHRQPPGFWARWRRQAPPPSIRLADSRSRYGLPLYRAHHAPTDALATAELLLAQVADRFAPQTPLGDVWR